MSLRKHIAAVAVVGAVLAPAATAAYDEYGAPRALPSDYAPAATSQYVPFVTDFPQVQSRPASRPAGMPRAMPADYEAYLARQPQSVPARFDWSDFGVGVGAGSTLLLALLGAGALATRQRRNRITGALAG